MLWFIGHLTVHDKNQTVKAAIRCQHVSHSFLISSKKKKVCVSLYRLFLSSHSPEIPPAFHVFIHNHSCPNDPEFYIRSCSLLDSLLTPWPENLSQQPAALFRWSGPFLELDRYFKVKGKHSAFAGGGGKQEDSTLLPLS